MATAVGNQPTANERPEERVSFAEVAEANEEQPPLPLSVTVGHRNLPFDRWVTSNLAPKSAWRDDRLGLARHAR